MAEQSLVGHAAAVKGTIEMMREETDRLLHRVFVPNEKRDVNGNLTFKTKDGERYRRDESGAIRAVGVKVNGKQTRKARARARRAR